MEEQSLSNQPQALGQLTLHPSVPQEVWVCGRSQEEARQRAAVRCGVPPEALTLTQGGPLVVGCHGNLWLCR